RIEGEDRDQMREVMGQLQIPDGMGAIVRTAGVGRSAPELQWDLDNLKAQWQQIEAAARERPAPFLVFRESDAVTRAMRDYLSDDIGEVLVDGQAAFQKAQEYMQRFMPAEAQRRLRRSRGSCASGISAASSSSTSSTWSCPRISARSRTGCAMR